MLLESLRPAFASKHPHFNFITVHCKFATPQLHPLARTNPRRLLDYWRGHIWFHMHLSPWRNRIHRCPLSLEWLSHPERPEYRQPK